MHDSDPGPLRSSDEKAGNPVAEPTTGPDAPADNDGNSFDDLRDDLAALVDDARTYAEAEIAFQKTRAGLAGRTAGRALVLLVLALVLFHIALIALAVGAVIALAPLVTIWGAIAIVVGVMLVAVAALVNAALGHGNMLSVMFGSGDEP